MAEQRKRSAFFRGESGMRRTDEEIERSKQKAEQRRAAGHQPFRFFVPVGDTREIVICDDKPDFFMYEHALKDAEGRWGRLFSGCVKTFDNCPVCEATGKESYYAMFLTVIDLTPFSMRDGTEVEFSRKLLVVKPAQQKKFLRFYNKEGTLRGAKFSMTRDGDKDSAIGNDIEFVEFVEEDDLAAYTRSWKDREGKKHTEICDEPFDYEKMFEEPTTEKLRAIVGGSPAPGSRQQAERELGSSRTRRAAKSDEDDERPQARRRATKDDDWEDADDEAPFDTDTPPRRRAREDSEEEAPEAPRRGVKTPSREVSRSGRAVAADDEEEAPVARSATRRVRQEEVEEEADEPSVARRVVARRARR